MRIGALISLDGRGIVGDGRRHPYSRGRKQVNNSRNQGAEKGRRARLTVRKDKRGENEEEDNKSD